MRANAYIITGWLCCLCLAFQAQVVNIEGKRFIKDTNGFVGRIEFNYNIIRNVQRVTVFANNVHAQYKHNKHRILAISEFSSVKAPNQDFVNSGYQHLRYNYKLGGIYTLEVFAQSQYNRVLKLDQRYLAGAGPRLRLLKEKHLKVYTALLYMYEYQSQNNDTLRSYNNRLSHYLSFTIDTKQLDISNTLFYQPNLANFDDYRLAGDCALEIEINKLFGFRTGFNFLYDTRQPPGVPACTFYLRNGIVIKL